MKLTFNFGYLILADGWGRNGGRYFSEDVYNQLDAGAILFGVIPSKIIPAKNSIEPFVSSGQIMNLIQTIITTSKHL